MVIMILDKKVLINISTRNKTIYKKLGYDTTKKQIIININELSRNSSCKINVKCDYCDKEREISYKQYMDSYENGEKYACCKICSRNKSKLTCMKKYGVNNVSESKIIKDKKKETNIQNWGTENVFQNEDIKKMSKETKKEKYGNKYFTNREKSWETCMKNNGVKYPMQKKEILEKRNKNNLKKFGKKHYQQTIEYQINVNISNLEKYGTKWYLQSQDKKEKSIKTCIRKYGVEYPMQCEKIINKMKKTKIKNGTYLNPDDLDDYIIYRRKVTSITKKYIKELFEKWDGHDLYDNEYIKDNFILGSKDRNYPTIDHIISVYKGFNNNIEPEIIGNINNLCITKMWINSKKNKY